MPCGCSAIDNFVPEYVVEKVFCEIIIFVSRRKIYGVIVSKKWVHNYYEATSDFLLRIKTSSLHPVGYIIRGWIQQLQFEFDYVFNI